MKNKKGISGIVTTVIIIGIAIVAVGVIWYVLNNVILGQTEGITYSEKCIKVNLRATKANCTTTTCDVLIKRSAGGDTFDGIQMVFYEAGGTSEIKESVGNIEPQATVRKSATGVTDTPPRTKVEVYPYFLKEDLSQHLCADASSVDVTY